MSEEGWKHAAQKIFSVHWIIYFPVIENKFIAWGYSNSCPTGIYLFEFSNNNSINNRGTRTNICTNVLNEWYHNIESRCLGLIYIKWLWVGSSLPSRHLLVKFNNGDIIAICEISSKLTTTPPEKTLKLPNDIVLVSLLITLNRFFNTLLWCFHCWFWTKK